MTAVKAAAPDRPLTARSLNGVLATAATLAVGATGGLLVERVFAGVWSDLVSWTLFITACAVVSLVGGAIAGVVSSYVSVWRITPALERWLAESEPDEIQAMRDKLVGRQP